MKIGYFLPTYRKTIMWKCGAVDSFHLKAWKQPASRQRHLRVAGAYYLKGLIMVLAGGVVSKVVLLMTSSSYASTSSTL